MITLQDRIVEIEEVLEMGEAAIADEHPDTPALVQVRFVGPDGTLTDERPRIVNAIELQETEFGEIELALMQATPLREGMVDYPVAGACWPPGVPSWPGLSP
jgi:hypothetical protein